MQRRLNVKLLLATLTCLALAGGIVHVVHGQQMRLNAGAICHQAERMFLHKDYAKAAELFQIYLSHHPSDTEAIARYAAALEHSSTTSQARLKIFLLLEQVVRRRPENFEARKRAVQAAIDVGRWRDAIQHLHILLPSAEEKGTLEHQLGWCQEAMGKYDESLKSLRRAIAASPQQVESYILLANLLARHFKENDEATIVMDAMIAANQQSAQARLARARFRLERGLVDAAAADVYEACALGPLQPEVLLAGVEMAMIQGDLDSARAYANRGLKLNPKNEQLYLKLAVLEVRCGRPDDAVACLRRGLAQLSSSLILRVCLVETLLDQGQPREARALMAWFPEHNPPRGVMEYLDGRHLMSEKRWIAAIEKLTVAKERSGFAAPWAINLCASLGRCHEHMGESEKQLAAWRDAVAVDPTSVSTRLELSKALLAVGLAEDASLELRQLTALPKQPAEAWILTARALITRMNMQHPDSREWQELEGAVAKAFATGADGIELACLRGEMLLRLGQGAQGIALLKKKLTEHSKETRLRVALAQIQGRFGQDADALATLDDAQRELGPRLEILLAVVKYWTTRPGPQARAALVQLGPHITALSPDDRVPVFRQLAPALLRLGDPRAAEQVLQQLAGQLPDDLECRLLLFDLALNDNRYEQAADIVAELRRIEGEIGLLWRAGEAARGIAKANAGDPSHLAIARKRLAEIRKQHGDIGRAVLLEGYVEELDGKLQRAMMLFQRAIDLGERPPALVLRVARWLADHNHFQEASQVFRKLEEQTPLPPEHAKLATEVALQCDDFKRAVSLAQKNVPAATRDYRALLWLARVQWAAGQPSDATHTLRKATELAPRVPEVWAALVLHLARIRQPAHLEDALVAMRQKMPLDRMDIALGMCLEAAGRLGEAEEAFLNALEANSQDTATIRLVIEFYLRTDQPSQAEPLLLRLVDDDIPIEFNTWARRQLALVLAKRNNTSYHQTAMAHLTKNAELAGPTVQDERALSFVLAHFPGKAAEAVRRFEVTLNKHPLTPDERFLLVQIYAAVGDEAKSNQQMAILLATHRDRPTYLAYHINALIRQGNQIAARTSFSLLEILEPASERTLQLKTALQKVKGS